MTFSTRPLLSSASRVLAFAFVTALALATSGCEDKHIGRPCSLGIADGGATSTGNTATINSQAVECPSRICLSPAADKNPQISPLCTADCSSDEDCEDGETSTTNNKLCKNGFVCVVPTTVGAFCCRRMCVCKDQIDTSTPAFRDTPEVCKAGQSTCQNVN
jgi:hypothetical protein